MCDFSSYKPFPKIIIGGWAISKPSPPYPPEAKAKRVGGHVRVKILVNLQNGLVERACVMEGHELLAEAAQKATLQARFSPNFAKNEYMNKYRYYQSIITYNFVLQ